MQRLGGADAVQDLHPEPVPESLEQRRRERFARRDRLAYRGERVVRDVGGQQRRVEGRHAEEQRRAPGADAFGDHLRCGPTGFQDRARAHRQREERRIADPVSEEQLRDREAPVIGPDTQDLPPVGLTDRADAGVPEPGTWMLLASSLCAFGLARKLRP